MNVTELDLIMGVGENYLKKSDYKHYI